jgi:hypothetical protein
MDDLIGRLVANSGVDCTAAEQAVGLRLRVLRGPAGMTRALIGSMLSAEAAMAASNPSSRSPSMFSLIGGVTGIGSRSTSAGPSMDRMQAVARKTVCAREIAGEDAVGDIVGAIPALGRSV